MRKEIEVKVFHNDIEIMCSKLILIAIKNNINEGGYLF